TGRNNLQAADARLERRAAPVRAVVIQPQLPHTTRRFLAGRVPWTQFRRSPAPLRKFFGTQFFQSRHRRRRKRSGTEAHRLRPGRARGCGPVARQAYAGPQYADNPDTIFLPQSRGIFLLEISAPKEVVAPCI